MSKSRIFWLITIHFIASIIGVIIPLLIWGVGWSGLFLGDFFKIFFTMGFPFGLLAGYICYRIDMKSNEHLRFGISFGFFLLNVTPSAVLSEIGRDFLFIIIPIP